ncbi:Light-regulated protein, chloroplastic, partial [Cucurbita argyrosperma subsp. sororia]
MLSLPTNHQIKGLLNAYEVPTKAPHFSNSTSTSHPTNKGKAFPAEACDTVGGEACDVEMYPEVKLKPEAKKGGGGGGGGGGGSVDREYRQYDRPKTVFPAEACDDLGW